MGLAAEEIPPDLHLPHPSPATAYREDQASECSSSFGFTDSSSEDEANTSAPTEVESAARDGNGVLLFDNERRRPLNVEWKSYRRGIEWRCRWISIRLMKLLRQASKYDEVLAGIQNARTFEASEGAARTSAVLEARSNRSLLHRHRRRKVEETVDAAEYMSRHPLFQRYEKKKRELEGEQHKEPNDLAMDGAMVRLEPAGGEEENQDSVENLMLKVERLQARVVRLRNQLRGSMSHKFPGSVARAAGGGGGVGGGGSTSKSAGVRLSKTLSSAHHTSSGVGKTVQTPRRRASDFDINNVVMPVSVGAKYVQHVRHANIETPQWRLAEKVEMREDESSGDEDTDEDAYRSNHAPLESQERFNRYGPRTNKKTEKPTARSSGMLQCSLSSQYN